MSKGEAVELASAVPLSQCVPVEVLQGVTLAVALLEGSLAVLLLPEPSGVKDVEDDKPEPLPLGLPMALPVALPVEPSEEPPGALAVTLGEGLELGVGVPEPLAVEV